MTGSGKTGLCLALLEEAAIDGIPAIAIDPKGDLGNLLLTFPELRPEDFRPWIDPAEAARKGISPDELADADGRAVARRAGRVGAGRRRGSRGFATRSTSRSTRPAAAPACRSRCCARSPLRRRRCSTDAEALRERIAAAVSGLLALLGIDADPLRSREHILLSNLLDHAWRDGQRPRPGGADPRHPVAAVRQGRRDRPGDVLPGQGALRPGDAAQQPARLARLRRPGWKASRSTSAACSTRRRASRGWRSSRSPTCRTPSGCSSSRSCSTKCWPGCARSRARRSLRALLYMDEVFGYFPPTANPPSKTPMLTLLKQARAFGLGVVLATQNPVDLDYKGLSNAGTWFLGRLQTERDKARVLDGLEGASAAAGATLRPRRRWSDVLSGLGNRVFLMNNVHEDQPVVFQTRWALSYLRGPLTREQIQTLMAPRKQAKAVPAARLPAAGDRGRRPRRRAAVRDLADSSGSGSRPRPSSTAGSRPVVPPDVPEFFIPRRDRHAAGGAAALPPRAPGRGPAPLRRQEVRRRPLGDPGLLRPIGEEMPADVWDGAEVHADRVPELEKTPEPGASFAPLAARAVPGQVLCRVDQGPEELPLSRLEADHLVLPRR